jgi:hypothetical protein
MSPIPPPKTTIFVSPLFSASMADGWVSVPHATSASFAAPACGGTGIGTVTYVFGRFTGR